MLSAGRSLLGAVFAPLGSEEQCGAGGKGLPRAGDAPCSGQSTPQARAPFPITGARSGGGCWERRTGERAEQILQGARQSLEGLASCGGQQSPRLCAGGLFTKSCGQGVEEFVIKTCSCSQRDFPREDGPKSM